MLWQKLEAAPRKLWYQVKVGLQSMQPFKDGALALAAMGGLGTFCDSPSEISPSGVPLSSTDPEVVLAQRTDTHNHPCSPSFLQLLHSCHHWNPGTYLSCWGRRMDIVGLVKWSGLYFLGRKQKRFTDWSHKQLPLRLILTSNTLQDCYLI